VAGIKEYTAWCAAPKTKTREFMKQTNLILMPPRQKSPVREEKAWRVGELQGGSGTSSRVAGIMLWKHIQKMAGVSSLANISPGYGS